MPLNGLQRKPFPLTSDSVRRLPLTRAPSSSAYKQKTIEIRFFLGKIIFLGQGVEEQRIRGELLLTWGQQKYRKYNKS